VNHGGGGAFFYLRHGKGGFSSAVGGGAGGVTVPRNAQVAKAGGDISSLSADWDEDAGERGGEGEGVATRFTYYLVGS
jgi:hypothetical protein